MKARAGNSLTKWDFQITNKTDWVEMGFLNYKRESRFTIHQNTFIVITEIREKGKRRYRGYKNVKNIHIYMHFVDDVKYM